MTVAPPDSRSHHVRDIVEQLDALTDHESVSVSDIVGAFGASAFVPVMMVPALLVVSPLSGIPLFSSICGLTIALIAIQLLLRRPALWLPPVLMRREVAGSRLHDGMSRIRGVADWMDRHSRDRLGALVSLRARPAIHGGCLLSGLAMPLLEVVPFSSSLLGMAVLCFASALLAADGLFVALGLFFIVLASAIPLTVVGSVVVA